MTPDDANPLLSVDFQALFDASPTPFIVVAPPNWTIVAANDARLRVTNTTREQQIGRPLFDIFPDDPDDPQADGVRNLTASLNRVVATKAPDTMAVQRYAVRDLDGQFIERWWTPVNSPVLNGDGDVSLIIHRVEDVTEVVRLRGDAEARDQLATDQQGVINQLRVSEAALRISEAGLRLVVDGARDHAIMTTDPAGVVITWSQGAEAIFGWTAEEMIGQGGSRLLTPEDLAAGVDCPRTRNGGSDRICG